MSAKSALRQGGFTLIELVVVVAVIGLLASIGIPAFLAQRDEGYDAQATADARQLTMVVEDARDGSGDYPDTLPAYRRSASTAAAVYFAAGDTYCALVRSETGHVFRVTSDGGAVVQVEGDCSGPTG